MDDSIFEDLEQLFEECDDITRSFNKTVIAKEQIIDLQSTDDNTHNADGDTRVIPNEKSKVTDLNKNECKITVSESNVNKSEIGMPKSDDNKTEFEKEVSSSDVNKTELETELSTLVNMSKGRVDDETDLSELPMKRSWKRMDEKESVKDETIISEESSKEEGECSSTFVEEKSPRCLIEEKVKKIKTEPEMNYSSFIDTSKEEGECSTTSFEDNELEITIKEVSPLKMTKLCSEAKTEKKGLLVFKPVTNELEKELKSQKNLKKRKRSISESNESTPKRRHLFKKDDDDDALSPISFLPSSADKGRNILEMADTPLIESKFRFHETKLSFLEKGVCSSTPVSTSQKFTFPSIVECSTPLSATSSVKHNTIAKKKILKVKESSDSDSDFPGFSDEDEVTEKCQTVEELIAEITQLCEDCEKTLEGENSEEEQNGEEPEKNEKTVSEIHLDELMNEWKARSSCEGSTDTDDEDNTLIADVKEDSQTDEIDSDESKSEKEEDKVGRFKAEVTVSRLDDEKNSVTKKEVVDMDICDTDEHEDDLLNLDDYDDEGFVDAKDLEKSHLLNQTLKAKETIENKDSVKGKESVEQPETLLKLVSNLKKEGKDHLDSGGKIEKGDNKNVIRGLDCAAFDTSIYRKNENTAVEREICRRWRTCGSADPDVNLTVASMKRNKCVQAGKTPVAGQLEGDHVVCTYLYEGEIVSSFKYYGKTTGQSDLCYMTLDDLLNRLYNQKEILENMNKQSLINIKQKLQWQLTGTQERHREELEALKYRQAMEDEQFRFYSRNQFNAIEFQNRVLQLRQDHLFQQSRLKEHHRLEFCAVQSRGLDILNQEINRHSAQCEPIGQLIEQLEKPEANAISSPQRYGPPIVVSLRKGPCRASNGKHSTVPVCLSAGIAQAVSLEDDLYDHYYGY